MLQRPLKRLSSRPPNASAASGTHRKADAPLAHLDVDCLVCGGCFEVELTMACSQGMVRCPNCSEPCDPFAEADPKAHGRERRAPPTDPWRPGGEPETTARWQTPAVLVEASRRRG